MFKKSHIVIVVNIQHSRPHWAQLIETFPVALFQDSDDFL